MKAVITAFTYMSTLNKMIEFADIFYNKRFTVEKQIRIDFIVSLEIIKAICRSVSVLQHVKGGEQHEETGIQRMNVSVR